MLRELREHEQQILTVRDLIVRELRQNARVCEGFHRDGWGIQGVQSHIRDQQWSGHATEWSVLRKGNPALWHEVADVYEALDETKRRGVAPPSEETLNDLADRLERAKP